MAQSKQKPLKETSASGNPLTPEFADLAKKTLDEFKVPGVSIAVIDDDKIFAEVRKTLASGDAYIETKS